jgi:hypothetical protein
MELMIGEKHELTYKIDGGWGDVEKRDIYRSL